jgi:deferrochelatase/peroxidase EfeB
MEVHMPDRLPDLAQTLKMLDLHANGADAYCQVSAAAARLLRAAVDMIERTGVDALAAVRELEGFGSEEEKDLREAMARWRLR